MPSDDRVRRYIEAGGLATGVEETREGPPFTEPPAWAIATPPYRDVLSFLMHSRGITSLVELHEEYLMVGGERPLGWFAHYACNLSECMGMTFYHHLSRALDTTREEAMALMHADMAEGLRDSYARGDPFLSLRRSNKLRIELHRAYTPEEAQM